MRILVTGGAGYIGSHTAKALHLAGHSPVVLDNLTTGHARSVMWGPLIVGDCGDIALVRRVLVEHRIEAVMHFAASAYVGESVRDPEPYFQNNVVSTLNLLSAMRLEGRRHIVFSSTCATYGSPVAPLISEEHPQSPLSPYGDSKLFIEKALRWFGEAYGLQWMSLRYFNAAGADPEGELTEDHDPETHAIPLIIRTALGRQPHFEILGSDYPTPDGTAIRDYTHVSDLADAHVKALSFLLETGTSTAVNLGTGYGSSVRALVRAVESATGRKVNVRLGPRRPGDPAVLVADSSRATQLLGWTPRYYKLQAMVSTALGLSPLQTGGARQDIATAPAAPHKTASEYGTSL